MRRFVVGAVIGVAAPAAAQSVNVNFGPAGATLPATYAAAGGAGTWNTVTGLAGPQFTLTSTDGASMVTLTQGPTTTLLATTDPSVSGDDATLLNNGLVTSGAETCLFFGGFEAGRYEVLIYAWLPNQPSVKSRTRQDEAPTTIDVGGAWSGAHAEGVTYARYIVDVGTDGALPAHSGLAPNAPDSALNAVQIRPLSQAGDAGAGSGGGADAGPGGGLNGDAGTTEPHGHGGCNAGGGTASPLVLVALLALRRRRR